MKRLFTISLSVLFGAAAMAQSLPQMDPNNYGTPKHTDKKFYIKDGKVTEASGAQESQKGPGDKTQYLDYFDVELDGYGFGDDNQVPRFYWTMHDSNYTHVGTAFTHVFDISTFDFSSFGDKYGNDPNAEYIIIDSVLFNLGHTNHSGTPNTLALSLKNLPLGGLPDPSGSIIWADTTMSADLTPTFAINQLPLFSVAVAETLATTDRGVYFEIFFDGVMGQDTASFLANYWESGINCPPLQGTGAVESFTFREHALQDGRTYLVDPTQSIVWQNPPETYYSNFNIFYDCNANGSYDRGTNEAYFVQNVAMGIWFTVGGEFFGINEQNSDVSDLSQNFPNPFSSTTTIEYTLVNSSNVAIEVFDITGKSVQYVNEGQKTAGSYQVTLNGSELNNGIYYYSFITDSGVVTRKMVVKH